MRTATQYGLLMAAMITIIAPAAVAQSQNQLPVCVARTLPVNAAADDYVVSITVSPTELQACSDADADALSVFSVTQPATITPEGKITIPYPDAPGETITVTYTVSDGKGGTTSSTITLTRQ